MENRKTVALIIPSEIVSEGLVSILEGSRLFHVEEILRDFPKPSDTRLSNLDPDVVIIDPVVLDFRCRKEGRSKLADICESVVIALDGPAVTEDMIKPYDGSISIYDKQGDVIRKLQGQRIAACIHAGEDAGKQGRIRTQTAEERADDRREHPGNDRGQRHKPAHGDEQFFRAAETPFEFRTEPQLIVQQIIQRTDHEEDCHDAVDDLYSHSGLPQHEAAEGCLGCCRIRIGIGLCHGFEGFAEIAVRNGAAPGVVVFDLGVEDLIDAAHGDKRHHVAGYAAGLVRSLAGAGIAL